MELNLKIQLLDKVLTEFANQTWGEVPVLVDGHGKYPPINSERDRQFRVIEGELVRLGLAEKIGGGDNSTINGYYRFRLTSKGHEHILSKKSSSIFYIEDPQNISNQYTLPMLDIFISHSSADEIVARHLIQVLRNSLNISPKSIRCTSVPGYKLEGGVNTDDRLRDEVTSCKLLVGIVSIASLESIYVLFELGARWGQKKPIKPLVYTTSIYSNVSGPLSNLHLINIAIRGEIHQFIEEVAEVLQISVQNPAIYEESIAELLAAISEHVRSQQESSEKAIDEPFEIKLGLTQEQEVLLREASEDPSGRIAIIHTKDGYGIQTNGKMFCNTHDGRTRARWEQAINYLYQEGLIESRNPNGTVFGLTVDGFNAADALRAT